MAQIGLLIVTKLSKIAISLTSARKHVLKTLYIQIYSPNSGIMLPAPSYSHVISTVYASSIRWCNNLDVRVIVSNLKKCQPNASNSRKLTNLTNIDVLLFDNCFSETEKTQISETFDRPAGQVNVSDVEAEQPSKIVKFDFDLNDARDDPKSVAVYDNVILGGTFDRLHVGHKILLTEAVLRAKKRLVVGVTDAEMVKTKTLPELVLPLNQRIEEVLEFLNAIDNTLHYEVVPIEDGYGPTKFDKNLDLLILSTETMKGGQKVNELRASKKMSELTIHCIDLIERETDHELKETKVSSTNQRMDLLGTRLQEPEHRPNLPAKPYIVGLMGGIASGKSVMTTRFEKLGAKILDCDKLAHELYEPDQDCYEEIVTVFGKRILADDGRINRKELGAIVFNDSDELAKLNEIVWPSLLKLVKERIAQIHREEKCEIVILEAAVLLKAGWEHECHEIWSIIVPRNEAIKRLIERNSLNEAEASKRLDAALDNETVVKHSNVVFSTQWSHEFSQIQAERAWHMLGKHLEKMNVQKRATSGSPLPLEQTV